MRWGGWTNPRLRRWMVTSVLLLLIGLGLHLIGGRPFDIAWLLVTLVACAVLVVGAYRHQDPEQ